MSDMQHRDIDEAASARVRAELAKRRMQVRTLSDATGIPTHTISRRINQRRANGRPAAGWRLDELAAIAKALSLPWDALLAGLDEAPPNGGVA